jgi:hypothetical protein
MPDAETSPEGPTPALPSFHDGYLTSIAVADKSATLGLQTSDGVAFELRLIGVEGLRADDFWAGNIILSFEVVKGSPPDWTDVDERLKHLFPPPHPSVTSDYHAAHEGRLAKAAERIAKGEVALVSIEPSYGCELVALCSQAYISSRGRNVSPP